jgi:hypothetical protein
LRCCWPTASPTHSRLPAYLTTCWPALSWPAGCTQPASLWLLASLLHHLPPAPAALSHHMLPKAPSPTHPSHIHPCCAVDHQHPLSRQHVAQRAFIQLRHSARLPALHRKSICSSSFTLTHCGRCGLLICTCNNISHANLLPNTTSSLFGPTSRRRACPFLSRRLRPPVHPLRGSTHPGRSPIEFHWQQPSASKGPLGHAPLVSFCAWANIWLGRVCSSAQAVAAPYLRGGRCIGQGRWAEVCTGPLPRFMQATPEIEEQRKPLRQLQPCQRALPSALACW